MATRENRAAQPPCLRNDRAIYGLSRVRIMCHHTCASPFAGSQGLRAFESAAAPGFFNTEPPMLDIVFLIIAFATGAPDATAQTGPTAAPPEEVAAEQPAPVAEKAEARSFASGEDLPPGHVPEAEPAESLPYEAEQQVATGRFLTALEVKPILAATRGNWIAVREFDGQDLIYVTHIWSWRCGLVALHVGLNGATPEPWPLPDCHEDTNAPNAVLPDDGLPYRTFPLGSVETITVELIYDDLTVERVSFNRKGALLP